VIEAAGEWVQLSVKDDGQGIARELLPRLFQPFVQGEQTLDRAQGGLGLGSCFTLRLPSADAPARRVELATVAAASRVRRLLVVDDEDDTRESLRALLALEGHEVATAAAGSTGLSQMESFEPQAALIDIGLPGMDGYELARRIRARWKDVALIAVTGYGQREDRERALAAGFDAHLTKPFSYEELMRTLAGIERRAAA